MPPPSPPDMGLSGQADRRPSGRPRLEALGARDLNGKELNGDGDTLKAWTPCVEPKLLMDNSVTVVTDV